MGLICVVLAIILLSNNNIILTMFAELREHDDIVERPEGAKNMSRRMIGQILIKATG